LPTGVGLGSLSCEYTKLTSLNLVGCTGLNDAFLRGNRFTQAAVDNLLSASVVNGVNNGQIWLDGFGNAAPSATGLGYKATLESAGRGFWLVVVNT
jgi:hypothetical protein